MCVCVYMWTHVCVDACVVHVFVWVHLWARVWVLVCGCVGVGSCVDVGAFVWLGDCVVHVCVCWRVCVGGLLRVWERV